MYDEDVAQADTNEEKKEEQVCRTQFVVYMKEALFNIKNLPTFISKLNLKFVTTCNEVAAR